MGSMKVSLDGMLANVETALRSSQSDMACALAYSLMEFGENLRLVKSGKATLDELFGLYVFRDEKEGDGLTKRVDKRDYDCMRDEEPEDVAED